MEACAGRVVPESLSVNTTFPEGASREIELIGHVDDEFSVEVLWLGEVDGRFDGRAIGC